MSIKRVINLSVAVMIIFFAANFSAFAVEKISVNTFNSCDEIFCDASDSGVFAYGYSGKTIYTQSFIPSAKSYSFTADGGFVGVPKLDKETVCAVYMTDDFNYHILCINCINGSVTYVEFDGLNDFNYNTVLVCNGRLYVMKTDDPYCYVVSYDFNGNRIFDYKFSEKNVNEIRINNGFVYAFLYDGSVFRLDNSSVEYCNTVRETNDIYNCGAGFISDSKGYIYSLNENTTYTNMYMQSKPFAVGMENIYYINANSIYCSSLGENYIEQYNAAFRYDNIFYSCEKAVAVTEDYNSAIILSNTDFQSEKPNSNIVETQPKTNPTVKPAGSKSADSSNYAFTDDGYLSNVDIGTTAAQLKKSCPQIISVTDKNGNKLSGKLKTGSVVTTKDRSYTVVILGDVTGTGEINSNDSKAIMKSLINENELFGAYKKAADYNLDGSVDNKDLVLIAQKK